MLAKKTIQVKIEVRSQISSFWLFFFVPRGLCTFFDMDIFDSRTANGKPVEKEVQLQSRSRKSASSSLELNFCFFYITDKIKIANLFNTSSLTWLDLIFELRYRSTWSDWSTATINNPTETQTLPLCLRKIIFKWGTFHQDLNNHSNEMTPCPPRFT